MEIIECIQGSDEWITARLGIVTASNFSDATAKGTGIIREKLAKKLTYERIHNKPFPQKFKKTDSMQHGTDTEEEGRNYFAEVLGVEIKQVGFVKHNDYIGCSPDGLIGEDGLIEIKCPDTLTHMDYIRDKKFPTTYKKQVQGQLWVTGRKWCWFGSYDPRYFDKPHFLIKVYRDDIYIKEKLAIPITMFVGELKEMVKEFSKSEF